MKFRILYNKYSKEYIVQERFLFIWFRISTSGTLKLLEDARMFVSDRIANKYIEVERINT